MHGRSRLFPHDRRHLPACTLFPLPRHVQPATDRTRLEPILHTLGFCVDRFRCRVPHLLCDRERHQPTYHGRRRRRAADNLERCVSFRALSHIACASRPTRPFTDAVCASAFHRARGCRPLVRPAPAHPCDVNGNEAGHHRRRRHDAEVRTTLGVRGLADDDLPVTRGHISEKRDDIPASRSSAQFYRMSGPGSRGGIPSASTLGHGADSLRGGFKVVLPLRLIAHRRWMYGDPYVCGGVAVPPVRFFDRRVVIDETWGCWAGGERVI